MTFESVSRLIQQANQKSDNWSRCLNLVRIKCSNYFIMISDHHQDPLWSATLENFLKIWPLFRLLLEVEDQHRSRWFLVQSKVHNFTSRMQKTVWKNVNTNSRTSIFHACCLNPRETLRSTWYMRTALPNAAVADRGLVNRIGISYYDYLCPNHTLCK